MSLLLTNRRPTSTTVSTPSSKDMNEVELLASESSPQIPTKAAATKRSSFRLALPRSVRQVCSKYQKKKKPSIRQSQPRLFFPRVIPELNGCPDHSPNPRPHSG